MGAYQRRQATGAEQNLKEDVDFKPSNCLEKFNAVDEEKVHEAVPTPDMVALDADTTDDDFSDNDL